MLPFPVSTCHSNYLPLASATQSIPPPPTEADANVSIGLDELWGLMTGENVGLTEVEAWVVFKRIEVVMSKPEETGGKRAQIAFAVFCSSTGK